MNRILKIFFFCRSLPSIAIFFILRSSHGVLLASLAAAGYAIIFTIMAEKAARTTRLDYGLILFWSMGLLTVTFLPAAGHSYFNDRFTTFLYISFLLATTMPMLWGAEPFTMAFARNRTPSLLWETKQFQTINQIMSLAWAALLFTAAMISLLPGAWFSIVLPLGLMIFIGIPFTRKFPAYYLNHHGKKSTNPGARNVHHAEENMTVSGTAPRTVCKMDISDEKDRKIDAEKMGPIKKAVVVFGSPRGTKGYTYKLLQQFLKGMNENGVEYEIISLNEKKIKPCAGCFTCWTKTPGVCIHNDDMAALLQKITETDLILYAQPLYTFSVPGITKNFLDRMLPQLQHYLVDDHKGGTRHPLRWREGSPARMLIFSVCGFPEVGHFQPMLDMFRAMAKNSGSPIIGEILRPASESLLFSDRYRERYQQLLQSLYEAGRQVADQGFVDSALEKGISQTFFKDTESFHTVANSMWDTLQEYYQLSKDNAELPPKHEYLKNHPRLIFGGMASMFNPENATGLNGSIQFELTDRPGEDYYLTVDGNGCRMQEGKRDQPILSIKTPWHIWLAISKGELSGRTALLDGLYRAEGDINILMKMQQIFDS